jgi:hypothetical protein
MTCCAARRGRRPAGPGTRPRSRSTPNRSGRRTTFDNQLAALATTRTALQGIAATEFTADAPTVISAAYLQILTVLNTAPAGMRAKDICLALGIEPLPNTSKVPARS